MAESTPTKNRTFIDSNRLREMAINFLDINIPKSSVKIYQYKSAISFFLGDEVIIPLIQDSSGDSYEWLIDTGDRVSEAQPIAKRLHRDSRANLTKTDPQRQKEYLFSSVPGVVEAFCDTPVISSYNNLKITEWDKDSAPSFVGASSTSPAVKIKVSGEFSFLGKEKKPLDLNRYSSKALNDLIAAFGILNTFDSLTAHLLADDIRARDFDTIVLRLFPQDYSVLTDSLVTKFFFKDVIEGATILSNAIGAQKIIFSYDKTPHDGVRTNQKDLTHQLDNYKKLNPSSPNFITAPLDTKFYPSANKGEMTKNLSNYLLDSNPLFIDSCMALDLYRSFNLGAGVISRYVLVMGDAIRRTAFLNVRLGVTFREIAEMLGGFLSPCVTVIINGFITGGNINSLDAPVTKSVKSIYFASRTVLHDQSAQECIHCGLCRAACPSHLAVDKVFDSLIDGRADIKENVFSKSAIFCDDCGLCNLVCPSRRPLCQVISLARQCH